MVKGLYTAYTGMINQMNKMDVMTNNLANSDTNGFKKEGATSQSFDHVLAIKIKDSSDFWLPKGLGGMSMGVQIGETYTDYDQGSFRVTDNTYDLALEGRGFFAVAFTSKNGQSTMKFTRDGAFTVNTEGYLVTKDGDYVLNAETAAGGGQAVPAGGITTERLPQGAVRVNPNAKIRVDIQGNVYEDENQNPVARIGVVDFADYNYLEKYGENMYQPIEGARVQASTARVRQGTLEMSNVNVVKEMVEMITITRAYETNQKLIQTIDTTLEKAVNNIGAI